MIVISKSTVVADQILAAGRARRWFPALVIVLTVITVASIVLMAKGHHAASAAGFLCVVLVALGTRLYDAGVQTSVDHLHVGLAGERAVAAVLAHLDHRYVLVNGLQFTQPRGELDHLLLGPHGLLGIETKAHRGHIACLAGHWRRWTIHEDGRMEDLPIGNPSAQLQRTLRLLGGLLSSWGVSCPVTGVIVFTHPEVELELQDLATPVVRLDELLHHISVLPTNILTSDEVTALAERLSAY